MSLTKVGSPHRIQPGCRQPQQRGGRPVIERSKFLFLSSITLDDIFLPNRCPLFSQPLGRVKHILANVLLLPSAATDSSRNYLLKLYRLGRLTVCFSFDFKGLQDRSAQYGNRCFRFSVGRLDRKKRPFRRIIAGHSVNFELVGRGLGEG